MLVEKRETHPHIYSYICAPCVVHPTFLSLQHMALAGNCLCNPSNFGVALQALMLGAIVGMVNCGAAMEMNVKAVQEYPILLSVAKL